MNSNRTSNNNDDNKSDDNRDDVDGDSNWLNKNPEGIKKTNFDVIDQINFAPNTN